MSFERRTSASKKWHGLRVTGVVLTLVMPCAQAWSESSSTTFPDLPTRFENFHEWALNASSIDSWTQQKGCALADDIPITEPERSGKFQNTSHAVITLNSAGKERLNRIRLRAPGSCMASPMQSKFMAGALAALSGQSYITNLSGMARGDRGGPFSVQAKERQACHALQDAEKQCCLKGFLAAVPELNAYINEIPDPDPVRFPERKSCKEAYDFGRMQAKFSCTFSDQCFMPVEACIPIRHLGCFHLGYTSFFASDECQGNPYRDSESSRQLHSLLEKGVVSDRLPKSPGSQYSGSPLPPEENSLPESTTGGSGAAK